jgi:5-formyltetrahydrofolate cyclo-ligase
MSADKAAWRRSVRAARRQRREAQGRPGRDVDADALAEHALRWLGRHSSSAGLPRCVTAYDAMPSEPSLDVLTARLQAAGVRVLVPITLGQGRLRWRDADPDLRADPLRPEEHPGPSWGEEILPEVDVALLPALAVGAEGTRLGQGGGYYDRWVPALRQARPDAAVVAVVYPAEVGGQVPSDAHDIQVDAVLTPDGPRALTRRASAADGTLPSP